MSAVLLRRPVLKRTSSFWLLGYAFLMLFVGTTIPTPLYRVYQGELHFSSGVLTLIFAVYVLFLIPSLLTFGQISDRIGRRAVILLGFSLGALGAAIFAGAEGLAPLFLARALQGISTGVVAGAGTAAMLELEPRGNRQRAAFAVSVANSSGAALGPLFGGILAQYGPWPTRLPYLIYLVLMLPIAALGFMPETVSQRRPFALELRLPAVPAEIRTQFAFASAVSFTVWAAAGLFLTLAPGYVQLLLGLGNLAIGGAFVSLMLFASSGAQVLSRRLTHKASITIGLILLPIGLASLALANPWQSGAMLLAGALIVGAGHGFGYLGAMVLINRLAPEARRAEVASGFYIVSYLGVAVPVIAVGFGAQWLGLLMAVAMFSGVVGLLALVLLAACGRLASCASKPAA
ncbi:MAG: MFS transporter [Hyphomicrobiales bacterium]|nr:MFS transporter [Hyphomicrobiales bacterium]MBV9973821.1 MFS transporter [Hyphomicrobiales bacterium]